MTFLKSQFTPIPSIPPRDLSSCTVLITGSNTGIGLETARELLRSKPKRMILAVRNLQRGNAAAMELRSGLRKGGGQEGGTSIEVKELDMADNASIKRFVEGLEGGRVDYAILNAGIWTMTYQQNSLGTELDLQVNVLGPALLPLLLLPNLREATKSSPHSTLETDAENKTPKPHLTFVTSGLHARARFPERNLALTSTSQPHTTYANKPATILSTLNDREKYTPNFDNAERYATSKLLNLLWAREFASKQTVAAGIVVNAANPGFCKTGLQRETSGILRYVKALVGAIFGRSVSAGARCIVDAVLAKGEESHGAYLSECKIGGEASWIPSSEGQAVQKRVWEEIIDWLKREGMLGEEEAFWFRSIDSFI